ncbi:hypothetical protein TNCV_1720881 [Trichonephila clavipes]|nr:hypothetical protein TNCV_1720881 [Trichonephila clavipes]
MPMTTHRVEGLMHVKSIVAQTPPTGMMRASLRERIKKKIENPSKRLTVSIFAIQHLDSSDQSFAGNLHCRGHFEGVDTLISTFPYGESGRERNDHGHPEVRRLRFEYYVDGRSIGEYRTAEVAAPSGGHLGRCDRLGFRQAMLQRPCWEGPKIHSENQEKKGGGERNVSWKV